MKRLLLSGIAACIAAPAFAQDSAETDNADETETIVITTPGPDRAADELIGNASVLERSIILDDLASSLGDTLSGQPGVSSTFFGQGASRPILRGLGAERVQVLTNGLGVIDASAASPDHQVTADGIDAERIEILRGPAALAYGGQAIGGVVNVLDGLIVDALPEQELQFDAFAAYNDVNDGVEGALRGRAQVGRFVLGVSASGRDFGDYDIPGFAESDRQRALEEEEHDEHDEDHGEEEEHDHEEEEDRDTLSNSFLETQTLGLGLSWVGDRAFFGASGRLQTSEYGLPGHSHEHEHEDEELTILPITSLGVSITDEGDEHDEHGEEEEAAFIDLEQVRYDLRAGLKFDSGPVTAILASLAYADYEHTEFEGPGEAGTVFANEGLEGRLEVDTAVAGWEGAVGAQFFDVDFSAVGEEAFVSPTESESIAIFAYQFKEWDSGFGVEAGGRVETVERDNILFGDRSFDLFSGSFGVHQHLNDAVFVGAQLSYTERAPNESELFSDGPHLATSQYEIGDPDLEVEAGLNLEGTARWSIDRVTVGVNAYVTEFSDFTYLSPRGDELDELPVFEFVQEDATFLGGEIYAQTKVNNLLGGDWLFDASLDYVQSELDSGGDVPLLPPMTFRAGAQGQWGPLGLNAELTRATKQDNPGEGRLVTDAYTLLRLGGDWAIVSRAEGRPETVIFVDVRNVTDEEARVATSVLKDIAPLPGRNIRTGLRVRF